MLGRKIRDCRLQQHMSQQQLAGSEVSRSMICLIEKGRCKPSWDTLQILAERLGKPVEYFLDEPVEPSELKGLRSLLAGLEEKPPPDPGTALEQAVTATRLAQRLGEAGLELKGTMLQGEFHMRARQYDHAVERFEDCVELARAAGDKAAMVQALYQAGRAMHFGEDLAAARRYYRRATRLAMGRKDLVDLHVRVLINLGSCCLRLADGPGALEAYQEAVTLAWDHGLEVTLRGQAFVGLALAYRNLRDTRNAEKTAMLAVQLLTKPSHPLLVVAKHNMAVILADQGRWNEAVPLFHECLEQFRQSQDLVRQAAVWEELARYHLHLGALRDAEGACKEALALLDRQDDGILRGRVYRVLGHIAAASGRRERALELYRTGLEILRRVKATEEVGETRACIEALAAPEPFSGKQE